jgi:hypothetical protein
VTLQDGKLRINDMETRALGENHFRRVNARVDFQFEASISGGPLRLIETRPGDQKPVVMASEATAYFTPSLSVLNEYAGIYRSEEIDRVYEIKIEENKLVLHRLKFGPDSRSTSGARSSNWLFSWLPHCFSLRPVRLRR